MSKGLKELLCKSYPDATKDIGDYSGKERNIYLAGMFGQNMIYSTVSSVLQIFYTDILIIPTRLRLGKTDLLIWKTDITSSSQQWRVPWQNCRLTAAH